MSDLPPERDRVLATFSLPVAGGLAVVGLALVLLAPSFAVSVAGASVLGLAGTVAICDVFVRIGLGEDRDRAQAERGVAGGDEHAHDEHEHDEHGAEHGHDHDERPHLERGRHNAQHEREHPPRDRAPAPRRPPHEDWRPRRRP